MVVVAKSEKQTAATLSSSSSRKSMRVRLKASRTHPSILTHCFSAFISIILTFTKWIQKPSIFICGLDQLAKKLRFFMKNLVKLLRSPFSRGLLSCQHSILFCLFCFEIARYWEKWATEVILRLH